MSTPSPAALLARVNDTVTYLRISVRSEAPDTAEWHDCQALVNDAQVLSAVVRSTAAGRGTDRDDIAMSLFAQAYAFRVAAVAVGSWLISDGAATLDPDPANLSIALGRHRPNAVALHEARHSYAGIAEVLFDEHLTPFVATARAWAQIGERLLWSNMAAGCAAVFGAFHAALGTVVRTRAAQFWALAPESFATAGQFVEFQGAAETGWFFERNACCLLYQVQPADPGAAPTMCEDCSLHTAETRQARYQAATAKTAE